MRPGSLSPAPRYCLPGLGVVRLTGGLDAAGADVVPDRGVVAVAEPEAQAIDPACASLDVEALAEKLRRPDQAVRGGFNLRKIAASCGYVHEHRDVAVLRDDVDPLAFAAALV